jgi:hypothetical protein
MARPPHEGDVAPPTTRETALVAVGQGAIMLFGGVLALLVAQIFGKNTETDAFFAAYAVYSLGLTFAQSFRLTAVPNLVESPSGDAITRMLGAAVVIIAAITLPMVVLAGPTGTLLVAEDPTETAPAVLRILWIALAGQLLAGMLLTALTVRGRFKLIGVASVSVGLVSVGTFLATEEAIGIEAAAAGLAAAAVWFAAVLSVGLLKTGWRPSWSDTGGVLQLAREAGKLIFASATFIGSTFVYVLSIALAGHEGPGEATLFAYAYVLASVLLGLTGNVFVLVRSPSLTAGPDRTSRTAATAVSSVRFTIILAGPLIAMAVLVGAPVIEFALGSGFTDDDITSILVTLVLLIGWLLGTAASVFAVIELLARRELTRLALLSAAQAALVACLCAVGAAAWGIEGIALGVSAATVVITAVQLRWAFGEAWRGTAGRMLSSTSIQIGTLVAAFAPSALIVLAAGDGPVQLVIAGLVAAILTAAATRRVWPEESAVLLSMFRRSGHTTAVPR